MKLVLKQIEIAATVCDDVFKLNLLIEDGLIRVSGVVNVIYTNREVDPTLAYARFEIDVKSVTAILGDAELEVVNEEFIKEKAREIVLTY